jgi:outer membrane protein TolC
LIRESSIIIIVDCTSQDRHCPGESEASQKATTPRIRFSNDSAGHRPSDNSLNGVSIKSFFGEKSYVEYYSTAINLSWEADIWGKLRNQKEATLAEYLQTYEGGKAVQTQLVADIAQGFFNLLLLDKQLDITRRILS